MSISPASFSLLLLVTTLVLPSTPPARSDDFGPDAVRFSRQITGKILPYWYDTTVDWDRGGYLLSDDVAQKAPPAREKQLVTQSRMIWGFSHAVVKGYRDSQRDYLKAARQGYEFLHQRFLDPVHGGYFWKTDLEGNPTNDRKYLYGESFVIYALVEYYRASLDRSALDRAMDLFRVIQRHAHDRTHLGWGEHHTRDWKLITDPAAQIEVEVAGLKSANAHLHWMEALSELYEATRHSEVRAALAEALRLNARYFYPANAGASCFHRNADWSVVTDPRSAGLSYGHNVEFAWLMIRAEQVLGARPSWDHFQSIMKHALAHGYDHQRGGLYHRGVGDEPANDTDKIWWVQAEMLAALADSLRHRAHAGETKAMRSLLDFVGAHQIDPRTGVWLDTLDAAGQPKNAALAHNWKAAYHDLRAVIKFIDAFGSAK
ncbi:MAG: AGE family epimerase/isomerase [Limisphaerales bacterium]